MTQKTSSPSFKETLNLPETSFPMRANAKIDDPAMVKRWEDENLFEASFTHNKGRTKFIFHDGPPYANGHIHLGSAYNKILKDIACKAQRMSGKHVPVTPGWDCHGLPIELNVSKQFPGLSAQALKKECRAYAQKWVAIQREEFKSLGVLMNWQHPYLTMNPRYEADELHALGILVQRGYISKKNKTVPWCISCKTVLASAEIEYYERKDPSIFVTFQLQTDDATRLFPSLAVKKVSFLIWTTTPWTLPLNKAVLLKPDTAYEVLEIDNQYVIVGSLLSDKVAQQMEQTKKSIAEVPAAQLEALLVNHPFIDGLKVPVILDQSVSVGEGTACVHCAPGCGPEDYEVGIKHQLEIASPISAEGVYGHGIEPPELEGVSVIDGQGWVLKRLREVDALLFKQSLKHSYPHCWRCRNGLIFRATKQWFLDLSCQELRKKALDALETIRFIPERTQNFLKAAVATRPEWCISRQRSWGVPIPALICTNCSYAFTSAELIATIAHGVEQHGVEYWDSISLESLDIKGLRCEQCHAAQFEKEKDILDVWFDSGISHFAVLRGSQELGFPADLYLEGLDQHRGWFQSSLLTSMSLEGAPSMKTIVTHGFTVDQKGHKMSKSLGNVVTPQEIIAKIGTDGLRLWAASTDLSGDALVSDILLQNIAHVYRKIRNTARFLLANLNDFEYSRDAIPLNGMLPIDRYALEQLFHANYTIVNAYHDYKFTTVFHTLVDYCTNDLSSFYLDIIKDRLYVEQPDGLLRRSAQTACWYIIDTLTRAIAPVLSFTAEQIADCYQVDKKVSIHLQEFAVLEDIWNLMTETRDVHISQLFEWYPHAGRTEQTAKTIQTMAFHKKRNLQWSTILTLRNALLKAIEEQREKGMVKHPLEVKLTMFLKLAPEAMAALNGFLKELSKVLQTKQNFFQELLVISQFVEQANEKGLAESAELPGLWYKVEHADGHKCPRCWKWEIAEHPHRLCSRCQTVLK